MKLPTLHLSGPVNWGMCLLALAIPIAALLLGFVSSTGNPIVIALGAGCIFGIGLFIKPMLGFWIAVAGAFFIVGPIAQFAPAVEKATWLFSLLGFALLMIALLHLLMQHDRKPLPGLFYVALALVAYSLFGSILLSPSLSEVFSGLKRQYQAWGVFFAMAALPFALHDVERLKRWMTVMVLGQLPFAIYQLLVWVPARVGMGNGVVPLDAVSGMFEADFFGGGSSSIMAFVLVLAVAYLFKLWLSGEIKLGRFLLIFPFVAAPLAMGETKIVAVTLPLAILITLRAELTRRPFVGFMIVTITMIVTILLGYLYLLLSIPEGSTLARTVDMTIAYNFGSEGYSPTQALNRTTALAFWWQEQSWQDPVGALFGHGLGSSYDDARALFPAHMNVRYPMMGIGLTSATTVLWDLGILGMTLYMLIFYLGWHCSRKAIERHTDTSFGALLHMVEAGMVLNFIMFFYADFHTLRFSYGVLQSVLLGLAVVGMKLPRAQDQVGVRHGSRS